jgi:hypothetical protein
MKLTRRFFVSAVLGFCIVGCDSSLDEPKPEEQAKGGMTDEFKALMEKNAAKMKMKGKPKDTPPAEKQQ